MHIIKRNVPFINSLNSCHAMLVITPVKYRVNAERSDSLSTDIVYTFIRTPQRCFPPGVSPVCSPPAQTSVSSWPLRSSTPAYTCRQCQDSPAVGHTQVSRFVYTGQAGTILLLHMHHEYAWGKVASITHCPRYLLVPDHLIQYAGSLSAQTFLYPLLKNTRGVYVIQHNCVT